MQKLIKLFIMVLPALVLVTGCRPDDIVNYQAREAGNTNSISGVWKGVSVIQRDNDAERKNFPYKQQDITSVLDFTKVTLTLNSSTNPPSVNLPSTFAINYNGAPAFFKINSGGWKVDNLTKIGTIYLFNGTDTLQFAMGSYLLLDQNKLQIKQVKSLLGREAVTYEFNFSK